MLDTDAPADLPEGGSVSPAYATMLYSLDGFGIVPLLFAGDLRPTLVNVEAVRIPYCFFQTTKVWVLDSCVQVSAMDTCGKYFTDRVVLFKDLPPFIQGLVRGGSPGFYSPQGEELS